MITTAGPQMGRFSVEVELSNNDDLAAARRGIIAADQVRRVRIRGVVDSGATRLVIPTKVAEHLRVGFRGAATVRYADGRSAQLDIAREIHLSFGDREGVFNAIVEPDRESALIGAIVMEDLDLLIDCTTGKFVPRDPKQIISEIE